MRLSSTRRTPWQAIPSNKYLLLSVFGFSWIMQLTKPLYLFPPQPRWWVLVFKTQPAHTRKRHHRLHTNYPAPKTSRQRLHTNNFTPTTSHQRLHTSDFTPTTSHQQLHTNVVTLTTSHQRLHTNDFATTISHQRYHTNRQHTNR